MPAMAYPTSNYTKHKKSDSYLEVPLESRSCDQRQTPSRSVCSMPVEATVPRTERRFSNVEENRKNQVPYQFPLRNVPSYHFQVQKQLETIRSLCDSMLEQNSAGLQNLPNNCTSSPLYSEPRRFDSPITNSMNNMNVIQPPLSWLPTPFGSAQNATNGDQSSNYQNWLTTNTLQTQTFMLNTLNQCCQMLWLQQRELAVLRTTVAMVRVE